MGAMFARICARAGLHVHGYPEYPSLIRGGHNTAMVRVGAKKVLGHDPKIDVLLALNKDALDLHLSELNDGAAVIYDGESVPYDFSAVQGLPAGVRIVSVPFARITKELEADRVMRNTVALGASFAVLSGDFNLIYNVLERTFLRKGPEVVEHNSRVARAGYDFVLKNFGEGLCGKKLTAVAGALERMLLSGNDAIAIGAIKSGLKFMSAYPMTPVTSIMQTVAANGVKYGIVMKQTEDEIAAINMAIGAAHMGVRAMTASSGGGFALMTEALGMSAMTETPLVVVMGTRPGPSTGMPTWTEQSDLRFVMHASSGEFGRVVFLPGDNDECFEMTLAAFNLAEEYQMPCFILTDKYLGESVSTTEIFEHKKYKVKRGTLMSISDATRVKDGDFKRFENTASGISPRAVPGYPNCIYTAATDEHNEFGDLDETGENRKKMMDKRARKMVALKSHGLPESERFCLHGEADADLTIVGWGSTKGPILEAMNLACEKGLKVNFLQIKCALPFPVDGVAAILAKAGKILDVENNSEAQMAGVIRENTGILISDRFLRYDGRPLNAREIFKKIISL
jgi:2-oxoglutarate ferredoxin oxidoreductase subunit alpha